MLEFRLALLTLAVCLTYVPGIPSGATAPKWWVLALGLLSLSWKWRLAVPQFILPVVLLLTWCVIGLFWTATPWDTLEGLVALCLLGVTFLWGAQAKSLNWCWESAALACWLQIPVMLLQYVYGYDNLIQTVSNTPTGLMLTKNMMAELALVAGVGVLFTRHRFLVLGPVVCAALIWAKDPPWEVLLGASAACVVFLFSYLRSRWKFLALAFFALVLCCGIIVKAGTLDERFEIWQITLNAALQHPLGWGLNSFADAAPDIEYVHNDFIQWFFELGFPGVLFGSVILWMAFRASGGVAEKCILAAILACATIWWALRCPATAFIAALVIGHLYGRNVSVDIPERRRRAYRFLRDTQYHDISSDTIRAARAGGEVVPPRPEHSLVGGAVS